MWITFADAVATDAVRTHTSMFDLNRTESDSDDVEDEYDTNDLGLAIETDPAGAPSLSSVGIPSAALTGNDHRPCWVPIACVCVLR